MMFLYGLLGLGILFAIGGVWAFIEDKVTDSNIKKWNEESKLKWKHREEAEIELYNTNHALKEEIDKNKIHIEVLLNSISGGLYPKDYNAEMCLVHITPQLFVKHYQVVSAHVNWKDQESAIRFIKDALLEDYPILIVDDIIKLFYYIFKTEQNVDMLKLIVNFDKSSKSLLALSSSEEEIKSCISEAERLIRVAENRNNL